MKRMLAVAVAAAAFSAAAVAPASAQKKATKAAPSAGGSVEEQIKKLETERAQAVVRADVKALEAQTSDDYVLINANGQLSDKAQTMSDIKSGRIKLTSNELSDLKVRVYGNTAVVTGRSAAKGTIGGRELKAPVLFTRVYVKKDGRWQSVAFQQTPVVNP